MNSEHEKLLTRSNEPRARLAWGAPRAMVLVATLGFLAVGCGDDATGPGSLLLGSFSAQVSGAVDASFSGMAIFGSADDFLGTGEEVFVLVLEDDTGLREIDLLKTTAGRPGPGTFTIGEYLASPLQGEFIEDGPSETRFFHTGTGTLTITSSSTQSLEGTLSFTANEEFGSGVVQVQATFNAMCIPGAWSCD